MKNYSLWFGSAPPQRWHANWEFLRYALDELAGSGVDTKACELAYDGIRTIPPELAAQILIVLKTRYEKWLTDTTTTSSMNGALSSLSNLVGKLLPHAKEQLLIFRRKTDGRYSRADSPTISVKASSLYGEDGFVRMAYRVNAPGISVSYLKTTN